ncbi:NUDIX domain-containing protein [Bacillus sp. REN10]|uniref:NUDIX hydrolase n=1 Tax=Bacillus sp. REN10 TaxID=2782541 RepID=UPI00193B355D|nr:NUDIX domain-containing protein [Bacillus sp. REN10]
METEVLAVFDEEGNRIGEATREEVHQKGLWHETFHCWVVSGHDVYLQIRSEQKKDFPNLLDITAAGHLLAQETVQDGVREVQEELGIEVKFEELIPLGVVKDRLQVSNFLDHERCHVFLHKTDQSIAVSELQREEVAGIVKVKLSTFCAFCLGETIEMNVHGEYIDNAGIIHSIQKTVDQTDIVPHEVSYFQQIGWLLKEKLL